MSRIDIGIARALGKRSDPQYEPSQYRRYAATHRHKSITFPEWNSGVVDCGWMMITCPLPETAYVWPAIAQIV